MRIRFFVAVAAASLAPLAVPACFPGGEGCQLQGACVNLGDVTYDNCCVVGGDCTFRFSDGHEVGPFDPESFEESDAALDEATAYCLGEDGAVDAGPGDDDGGQVVDDDAGETPVDSGVVIGVDAGADDAGAGDAGAGDAGAGDGGAGDGGATDAGATDAGPVDGGVST